MTKIYTGSSGQQRIHRRLMMRLSLPVLLAGVLLLLVGLHVAWRVHRLQKRGNEMLMINVAGIRVAEELETVVREARYRLKRFLADDESAQLEKIETLLPAARHWTGELGELVATARERQLVARLERGLEQVGKDFDAMRVENLQTAARDRIAMRLADEVVPNRVLVYIGRYIEHNEDELARSARRNEARANQLMLVLLLLGIGGGASMLVAGFWIARRVSRTIVQLSLPIRDAAGKLDEAVGPIAITANPGFEDLEIVLRSVSDRVGAVVERLHEREREAMRSEQLAALGRFAAGLAHELRNPLTSLKTIVQLAEKPADLTHRDLQVLEEEIERLDASVQSFLDFARPPDLEKQVVCLRQLLVQTTDLVNRNAQRQGVRLEIEAGDEPAIALADPAQIRQLLLNLVLNALDAVPWGGAIRLRVWQDSYGADGMMSQGDSWVCIAVEDSGLGVPRSLKQRIFEPFVSTKETGAGLGLAICKRIVEAHGGEIEATDSPHGGAAFIVRLPAAQAERKERNGDVIDRR